MKPACINKNKRHKETAIDTRPKPPRAFQTTSSKCPSTGKRRLKSMISSPISSNTIMTDRCEQLGAIRRTGCSDRLGIRIIQAGGRFIQKQNGRVLNKARATAARCCCPPDRLGVFLFNSDRPNRLKGNLFLLVSFRTLLKRPIRVA